MSQFDANARGRIAAVVKDTERRPRGRAIPPRRGNHTFNVRPGVCAQVTTKVTKATGNAPNVTLGVGAGLLCWLENGATTSSGITVPIYSTIKTQEIPTGPDLVQLLLIDGHLCVCVAGCEGG